MFVQERKTRFVKSKRFLTETSERNWNSLDFRVSKTLGNVGAMKPLYPIIVADKSALVAYQVPSRRGRCLSRVLTMLCNFAFFVKLTCFHGFATFLKSSC